MRQSIMLTVLATVVLGWGCNAEPCVPSFGVYASGTATNLAVAVCPVMNDSSIEPDCELAPSEIVDGGSITILHRLPAYKSYQVTIDEPLVVTLETSCGATERDFHHDDNGELEASMLLPPGSSCALTVVATISNDTQTCVFRRSDCADLETRCEGFDSDTGDDTTSTGG